VSLFATAVTEDVRLSVIVEGDGLNALSILGTFGGGYTISAPQLAAGPNMLLLYGSYNGSGHDWEVLSHKVYGDAKLIGDGSGLTYSDPAAARNSLGASSGVWPVSSGGTGRSTKPYTAMAKNADQMWAAGVDAKVTFQTLEVDNGITWASSTATMPRAGFISVTFSMIGDGAAWYIRVKKNATEFALTGQLNLGVGSWPAQFAVAANDTIEIWAQNPSGSDRYLYNDGGDGTRVTIVYLD
jgi:hypothetical protein